MTRHENEEQNNRQFLDEFLELYRQLSPWAAFRSISISNGFRFNVSWGKSPGTG